MLDRRDVIARLEQTGLRPGIQPRHPSTEPFHVELVPFQVNRIQIGDLELAPRGRFQRPAEFDYLAVINIETRYREITFRLLRLFFQTDRAAVGSEFDDTVPFGIPDLVSKDAGALLEGQRFAIEIQFSVKNIVTENEGGARVTEEIGAN